jgi:hypothetical protein
VYRKTRITNIVDENAAKKSIVNEDMAQSDEEEEIVEVPVGVTRSGLCSPDVRFRLMIMILLWIGASMNFLIINLFMQYVPGSEFVNFGIAACAEMTGNLVSGVFFTKFGAKMTFALGFICTLIGGGCLIF